MGGSAQPHRDDVLQAEQPADDDRPVGPGAGARRDQPVAARLHRIAVPAVAGDPGGDVVGVAGELGAVGHVRAVGGVVVAAMGVSLGPRPTPAVRRRVTDWWTMRHVRFLNTPPTYDLTYSDVFMVPRRSAVTSRLDVDLRSTDGVGTTLPLVVANMTAVSGRRMAETVARRGGVAIIPQDIPTDVVAEVVEKVKGSHPVFDTPVRVTPHTTVGEAMSLLPKRAHGLVVVVEDGKPLGTVSESDAAGVDRFAQVHEVMSSDLLVVAADESPTAIFDALSASHLEVALVVDDDRLLGVMTRKHALRSTLYKPAVDPSGRLMLGAAVGINGDVAGRAEAPAGCGGRRPRRRHRPRAPGEDAAGAEVGTGCPGPAGRPDRTADPAGRRQRGGGRRRTGSGRGRCRRGQGRRRTGRHVHHPDDDRGRSAAVQRGAGVRRGRARGRRARSGPTAGCATRGTSRWRWPPEPAR